MFSCTVARAALGSSLGVSAGLSVCTVAAAIGLASLVRASAVAFTALKLIGALYLIWLGVQTWRAAAHHTAGQSEPEHGQRRAMSAFGGFRQGFLSDLGNPKIGVFLTSLLPQFVDPGRPVLLPFVALGAVFVLMTVVWLAGYCLVAAWAAETLQLPRVKTILDHITGSVLVALGLRLAAEHR